jgi:hypothetical protein
MSVEDTLNVLVIDDSVDDRTRRFAQCTATPTSRWITSQTAIQKAAAFQRQ